MSALRRHVGEHLFAILLVGGVLGGIIVWIYLPGQSPVGEIERYLAADSVDFADPLHRMLFRESYAELRGAQSKELDSLMGVIERERQAQFTDPEKKAGGGKTRLSFASVATLLPMFVSFLFVYAVVLAATFLAARILAVYRFAAVKNRRASAEREAQHRKEHRGGRPISARAVALVKAILRGVATLVLFSPAYVIAYALRTRLDTENDAFMIFLGIVSNGLLVNYANKFYALLVAESRKGYVETALVKGLGSSYALGSRHGLSWEAILFPVAGSRGHVFRHIYLNARFQFIPTLKEHAAFLVTGLVIIEMALNIKGHLCYTLLQHLLYREYDLVIVIVFGIFLAVKATELLVDVWHDVLSRRYGNVEES
ncbi:MAG: hypothetical protein AB1428_14845 [Bacteroidota bacterium]